MNEINYKKFIELIKDQFQYGGKKYGLNSQKESTDELFDAHGASWLFGTCDKYTYRFKNLARERDILKIATYQYILWLKRGFFIIPQGINDPPIDTNLEIKEKNFNRFLNNIKQYESIHDHYNKLTKKTLFKNKEYLVYDDSLLLDTISKQLKLFSKSAWKEVSETSLAKIFWLSFYLWDRNFSQKAGQDIDTYNKK